VGRGSPNIAVVIDVDEIHDELPTVEAYGARHPDEYAGAYIEGSPPRRVRVGFTRRLVEHRAELLSEFPYGRWLSMFEARHSLRELQHARDRLRDDEPYLRQMGVHFGLELADNCVWLEAWRPEPRHLAALAERYGTAVKIIHVTEGRRVSVEVLDVRGRDERSVSVRYVSGGDRLVSTAEVGRKGDDWVVQLFAEVAPWVNVLRRNRQVREMTIRLAEPEDREPGRGIADD